jgi:hypothetical protein
MKKTFLSLLLLFSLSVNAQFDTSTTRFMAAVGIPYDCTVYFSGTSQQRTGIELWQYTDEFVKDLKGIGLINSTVNYWYGKHIKFIHPVLGGDPKDHTYNLIDTGTRKVVYYGAWVHSSTGAKPNSSTSYADAGISPLEMDGNNFNLGRYNGSAPTSSSSAGTQIGVWNGSKAWAIHHTASTTFMTINTFSNAVPDFLSAGLMSLNRLGGNTRGFKRGCRVTNYNQAYITGLNLNFTYNCMQHTNGSRSFYSPEQLRFGYVMDGLTDEEQRILNNIIENFQIKLGRSNISKRAYVYGESVPGGVGATPTLRWPFLISKDKGWTEINMCVDGTTLQKSTPINRINSPNMYDQRLNIPYYDSLQDAALFVSYSINDNGLIHLGAYSTATYGIHCDSIINKGLSRGWPSHRIIFVIGSYVEEPAGWLYYQSLGAPATSNATHLELINIADSVCNIYDATFLSPYNKLIGVPGALLSDKRHLTNLGHGIVRDSCVAPGLIGLN